jgi:hypothetical protein
VVRLLHLLAWVVVLAVSAPVRAEDPWLRDGADGKPEVQLYFFWSLTCPHCTAAHPYIEAIPQARPWVRLHALELSRQPENVRRYETLAHGLGEQAAAVPALIFCGEMHVGWDGDEVTGAHDPPAPRRVPRTRRRRTGHRAPSRRRRPSSICP